MIDDSSASGYLTDAMEGVSHTFTDMEIITTSDVNVVAKAKRYGRWWLLKGLREEVASEVAYQQRLRKELEILIQLQHPHIVAAFSMEEVEGMGRCIVMEYVDGLTLKAWLQGETTRQQRRHVAMELTEAVAYIHSKGIAHRDLKPENIIVTRNGENVKLIDFGLADTDSYAVLKQPAGTPRYMSPEQARTAVADSRNDIYSLGVIFSMMDIGCRAVVRKCQLSIDQRYQNVAALLHDLQRGEGRSARIIVGVLTVLMAVLMVVVGWQWKKMDQQERLLVEQTVQQQREQLKQRQQLTMVQDSLRAMQADNEQIKAVNERVQAREKGQAQQRLRVKKAIDKGYGVIDRAVSQCGMEQFLDTLSDIRYVYTAYSQRVTAVYKTVNGYWKDIEKNFSDTEMAEIKTAMSKHYSEQAERWNNKIKQLSK